MNKILIFLIVTVGLASSCIKEDVEPGKQGQLVTNEPYYIDTSSTKYLIFNGSIVAFGPIEVEEFGFVFTKSPSGTNVDPNLLDFATITSANKVNFGTTDQAIKFTHTLVNPSTGTYKIRTYVLLAGEDIPRFGNLQQINI